MAVQADQIAAVRKLQENGTPIIVLLGSCNPTTWRKEIAEPMLRNAGVPFFNPQVDDWTSDFQQYENAALAMSDIIVMVIDDMTRAISSMMEAAYYMNHKRLFFVIKEIPDGTHVRDQVITGRELQDLNMARSYVRDFAQRSGDPIFCTVEEAVAAAINAYKGL